MEQSHTQILSISDPEDVVPRLLMPSISDCYSWTAEPHISACLFHTKKTQTWCLKFVLWFLQFHVVPCLFSKYVYVIPVITGNFLTLVCLDRSIMLIIRQLRPLWTCCPLVGSWRTYRHAELIIKWISHVHLGCCEGHCMASRILSPPLCVELKRVIFTVCFHSLLFITILVLFFYE